MKLVRKANLQDLIAGRIQSVSAGACTVEIPDRTNGQLVVREESGRVVREFDLNDYNLTDLKREINRGVLEEH